MAFALIFISGLTALVYQVLWMKQLGLVFGNTTQAAAVTLAAFFGGLALGSWWWGRRSAQSDRPLRTYAWLEVGIAGSACVYFFILTIYHAVYPLIFQQVESAAVLLAVKFALALLLILPPTVFMGGTIPVMAQYLIGSRQNGRLPSGRALGTTGAVLYAVNTIGAASGALLAGFYLPLLLGYRLSFAAAITLTLLAAAGAFVMSRGRRAQGATQGATKPSQDAASQPNAQDAAEPLKASPSPSPTPTEAWSFAAVCFISGFGFLALEVLWTRMFMQVLENSVYTFAAILVVVLVCLALGAGLSSVLARLKASPVHVLAALLVASALAVALTPQVFMQATDQMQVLATDASWAGYVGKVVLTVGVTIGPPALILGAVFPYLMKIEEKYVASAGQSIGRLAAINTLGAIVGSLLCGFVLIAWLGMWMTMLVLALLYAAAVVILPLPWKGGGLATRLAAAVAVVVMIAWLNPVALPIVGTDPMRDYEERIIETWETSSGIVAVTDSNRGLTIRLNSHYGLGNTGSAPQEQMQTDLPLRIYPQTRSIFYLGMGTGITAGSALHPAFENVESIVVCELVPQVIEAARKYITDVDGRDLTGGLFTDPRATVLAEDGRHYLMATDRRFDMINADLFVPFRSGVGSLYTREHFENVRQRLTPDGVFVQWLPLYQVTEKEFGIIARTMLEVFGQVSLWRNGFQPGQDTVALIGHNQPGHNQPGPIPPTEVDNPELMRAAVAGATVRDLGRLALPFNEQTSLLFYCGNVTANAGLFADYPVNTDDYPAIEYLAPRSFRGHDAQQWPWFAGPAFAELVNTMQAACPPESDPLLATRDERDRLLVQAGQHFYEARMWMLMGDPARSQASWQRFVAAWLQAAQE